MRLKNLQLRNFRNISELSLDPSKVVNIFIGDNGQGKTSLVESIYYLSTLKSFRVAKKIHLVQQGTDQTSISAQVSSSKFNDLFLNVKFNASQKFLSLNEKKVSSLKFQSTLKTVVFSPESLAAIKYGPDLRRELIDQATFQTSEGARAAQGDFSRALKQRNALLRQVRDGSLDKIRAQDILESLDEVYLKSAALLTFERLVFLQKITPKIVEVLSQINGTKSDLYVLYTSGEKEWVEIEEVAVFERLKKELTDVTRRETEMSLGATLTGPHRHDVSFIFNGNDSRIFCSQGQQRALILAFKIAEIVYHGEVFGTFPLLLLDDVLSEFDESKRQYLIDFLWKNEAQTFLTATEQSKNMIGPSDVSVFRLKAGGMEPV